LLLPHHGSRTSSTAEFLAAVRAGIAVIPVGYRNRFGHPNADVVGRLSGINIFRTDRDGAVTARLSARELQVEGERQRRRRYWHDAPG
jgi:competence protein ComEC